MADADRIVQNSSTILYRLDPKFPYPVRYVSRNIGRFGYTQSQIVSAHDGFFDLFHSGDCREILADIAKIIDDDVREASGEYRLREAAGAPRWGENRMWSVRDADGRLTAFEGILADITDTKNAEAEMARLTYTDLLTGLPNRTSFMEMLLATPKAKSSPLMTAFLISSIQARARAHRNRAHGNNLRASERDRPLAGARRAYRDRRLRHRLLVARIFASNS